MISRNPRMEVGEGDLTVAAWINPSELRQAGIVCLGQYNWVHGWYLDMLQGGVLRIETVNPANQSNGTVATKPGILKANTWQHVAAVVRRGENQTRLFVNGFEVASGTVAPTNLDNTSVALHIGRIQGSRLFKGQLDEVCFYNRALDLTEIQTLLEPGQQFVREPSESPQELTLNLGERKFTGTLHQPAFVGVRLPAGPLPVSGDYGDGLAPHRINITPMPAESDLAAE
ncbi:LamG domain-containing protein [bacterium]|nr:LamG domain-containing protein [bacterium]